MSLQSQLNSFVVRVANLFQQIDSRTGALDRLDTVAKSDIVAAINELAARPVGGSGGSGSSGGSGGVAYRHQQNSPATVWVINHNLGFWPAVSIVDTGGFEIEADVRHMSANQVVIVFAIPLAGVARLI